jgi:transcriptional regulator GlxA family with amidase domain
LAWRERTPEGQLAKARELLQFGDFPVDRIAFEVCYPIRARFAKSSFGLLA